jgi:hypothetical protein
LVDCRTSPYIRFDIHECLAVRRIKQNPSSYIELTLEIEERSFDEFLDDEGVVAVLLDFVTLFVFQLTLHLVVIVVMDLEDGGFVFSSSSYSVMSGHDISELVKVLENMDSNTSVESSGF